MKHLKKIISMTLVAAMALTMVMTTNVTTTFAKSKVSSLKVVGAKKNVTMKEGAKKTYKVKVKASKKKNKGFSVKSSKKSIVAVKKKGTKFTLTAKKPGKAKITVKANKNKKKKYVFTVTVKKEDVKPDVKPVENKLFTVNSWGGKNFEIVFDHEVDLTADMIKIMRKGSKDAKYIADDKVVNLSTDDKKTYVIETDYIYDIGEYALFSIPTLDKEYTFELCMSEVNKYHDERHIVKMTSGIKDSVEVYVYQENKASKINKIEGLPSGLEYSYDTDGELELRGKIEKSGVYTVKAEIEDEESKIVNCEIIIVAGNENEMAAYVDSQEDFAYNDGDDVLECRGSNYIYVSGGCGEYNVSLIEGDENIFDVYADTYEEDEDVMATDAYIEYETDEIGTHKAKVLVEDADDASLKAEAEYTLDVKAALKVSGTVTTKSGKAIKGAEVYLNNPVESKFSKYGETDENGRYVAFVEEGLYNIDASFDWSATKSIMKKSITKNSTFDFVLDDVYEVIVTSDENITFNNWYYNDEEMDYADFTGNRFFLTEGKCNYIAKGLTVIDGKLYKYEAVLDAEITADCTINVDFDLEEVETIDGFDLGTNAFANLDRDGQYALFTPSKTGEYNFKSDFEDGDPAIRVYSADGKEIMRADDMDDEGGYNFDGTAKLEKGKTYIINVYAYADEESEAPSGTVTVSEAE